MNRTTRRRQAGALIAAFLIVGVFAVVLALPEDNITPDPTDTTIDPDLTSTTESTTTTVLDPTQLDDVGKELYGIVQAGRASSYYVRFALSGSSLPIGATATTLEIWRSGPNLRQDTRITDPAGTTHGYNFGGPDGTVTCQEQPDIALTCAQSSTAPFPAENDFLSSIMDRLSRTDITARDETVLGVGARCFLLVGGEDDGRSEVCLTPEGVPLVVEVPGLRADAEEIAGEVDPAAFVPPAPVSGGTTTMSTTIDTVITPDDADS